MKSDFTVDLDLEKLFALPKEIEIKGSQIVRKSGLDYEAQLKKNMAESGHGRMYGPHQASAPGEAPAADTGAYINSLTTEMDGPLTSVTSTDQIQALILEFGGVKVSPRPLWIPTLEEIREPFLKAVAQLLK